MADYRMADYAAKAREAAAEGIVLLENTNGVLPFSSGTKVALFGRSQFHYYKSGTGSGGMVNTSYVTGIPDAIEADGTLILNRNVKAIYEAWLKDHPFDVGKGWASEPWFQEEMPITEEVLEAAAASQAAVIVIGRTAGEDQDNSARSGSWYLTETEEEMIRKVCGAFEKTVVLLNVGNIIDMSWADKYHPAAVAYVWQGGQEGGNAAADILTGKVSPSGKLPDTIPMDLNDMPSTEGFGNPRRAVYTEDIYVGYRYFETFAKDKVRYPFGYGLSYTSFSTDVAIEDNGFAALTAAGEEGLHTPEEFRRDGFFVRAQVTNTGTCAGKEVIQVYCGAPQGALGKAARGLCGFAKTRLLQPGECETLTIPVPAYALCSYDDAGVTGHKSCYVLEEGTYEIYAGTDVRSASCIGSLTVPELITAEQLREACAPTEDFDVIHPASSPGGTYAVSYKKASVRSMDLEKRISESIPPEIPYEGDLGIRLSDVASGTRTMDDFIGQFTDEDLTAITRGEGMCSPKVTPGIAGAFGGVTERLKELGIPAAGCSDGPSGIRMDCGTKAFAMPNGTLLAATFNESLSEELYEWEALELRKNKIDTLLGPGMNIHRNPLNGRNFEYFSEDPFLTGKMAAAQLKGLHKYHVTGTIKHFAANNQETNRHGVEAVLSERALREIYLKGFEIAVREAGAWSVMTSYNPMNGFWTASNYDLLTTILREEWGFDGIVMTDWWAKGNFEGEDGEVTNTAAKTLAQNDLNMVNPNASDDTADNSLEAIRTGRVPRSVYQRAAKNICRAVMKTSVFTRQLHGEDPLDEDLKTLLFEGEDPVSAMLQVAADENGTALIDGSLIDTARGANTLITVSLRERGQYRVEVTCRAGADAGVVAQLPLTVMLDKAQIGAITLSGAQKEWETHIFDITDPIFNTNCYLKLYFGQAGMEIKDVRMVMKESLEGKLREILAALKKDEKES